jgi:hypothetical protein
VVAAGAELDTAGAVLTAAGVLLWHAVRPPMMAIAAIPLTAASFFMTSLVWLVVHVPAECLRTHYARPASLPREKPRNAIYSPNLRNVPVNYLCDDLYGQIGAKWG